MEPWKSIKSHGQSTTFLSLQIPSGVEVIYFQGLGIPNVLRKIESAHEIIRYQRIGISLVPIDRLFTYPFKSFIPECKICRFPQGIEILRIGFPDLFPLLLWKYLGLYKYFIEATNFDFLYTTNSNCYLRLTKLYELIQGLPIAKLYAGTPLRAGRYTFVSGANRLMSRDTVSAILQNVRNLDRGLIEDVSQGKLLESIGFKIHALDTLDLHSIQDAQDLSDEKLRGLHQIRIKSTYSRVENDVKIMNFIHKRIISLDPKN
jgi:hypothetical protein